MGGDVALVLVDERRWLDLVLPGLDMFALVLLLGLGTLFLRRSDVLVLRRGHTRSVGRFQPLVAVMQSIIVYCGSM